MMMMNWIKAMRIGFIGVFLAVIVYQLFPDRSYNNPMNWMLHADSLTGTLVSTKLSKRSGHWIIEETLRKADTKDTCVLERLEIYSREWEAEYGRNELQIGSQKTIWEAHHNKRECHDTVIISRNRLAHTRDRWSLNVTFLGRSRVSHLSELLTFSKLLTYFFVLIALKNNKSHLHRNYPFFFLDISCRLFISIEWAG
jgi:hypothetical protein